MVPAPYRVVGISTLADLEFLGRVRLGHTLAGVVVRRARGLEVVPLASRRCRRFDISRVSMAVSTPLEHYPDSSSGGVEVFEGRPDTKDPQW